MYFPAADALDLALSKEHFAIKEHGLDSAINNPEVSWWPGTFPHAPDISRNDWQKMPEEMKLEFLAMTSVLAYVKDRWENELTKLSEG